jgi:hypothetical protein
VKTPCRIIGLADEVILKEIGRHAVSVTECKRLLTSVQVHFEVEPTAADLGSALLAARLMPLE